MRGWICLAVILFWASPASAIEVECPESTWYGNTLQDCPCCEICDDGSFVIKGESECPIAFTQPVPTARRPVTQTVYDAARGIRPNPEPRDSENGALEDIATFCRHKWNTDYSMQKYCREQQTDALVGLSPYGDLPEGDERRNIAGRCMIKWTKRDLTDWTMVEYCIDQQVGAYRSLR